MPVIPTVERMGARPTDLSRQPVVPIHLQTSQAGVIQAQGQIELGKGIASLGDSLARLNERDRILMNQARAEDATTQYLDDLNRYTYDPDVGYKNKKGRNALETDLRGEYHDKLDESAKRIEESLSGAEQINAFRQRVDIANRQFSSGLTQHVAGQRDAFHEQVYEGVLQSERNRAAANWREPGTIESSVLRSFHAIDLEATRKGIPQAATLLMQQAAETQIHSNVVQTMLMEGNDQAALQYFNGVRERLTPESRITLGLKVNAGATDGEALRAAESTWAKEGPKGENDPIMLANMEDSIKTKYTDNPKVAEAAIAQLRSKTQMFNVQQNELKAYRKSVVLEAYNKGADLASMQTMPEYIGMDGASKAELRDYVLNRGWTEQQRAHADSQFLESEKGKQGFQTYWELSDPIVLNATSERELLSREPQLGRELVGDLMTQKRRLAAAGAAGKGILSATVDDDMFKAAADEVGLKPYDKNLSSDSKAMLGHLKNRVETRISEAQLQVGRELTRDEKENVMRTEVDNVVMRKTGIWPFNGEQRIPSGAVGPKQRADVYVPIANIDNGWAGLAMNKMRSEGWASFKDDDASIKRKYKTRLEKAYAIRVSGGSQQEIDLALKGQ